jgi:predicted permease
MFNNTTALPLLLFNSLDSQGAIDDLLGKSDSRNDASRRARNYILIHALICNLGKFLANGGRLLDTQLSIKYCTARFMFGPLLLSSNRGTHDYTHIFSHHETPHIPVAKDSPSPNDSQQNEDDAERAPLLPPGNSPSIKQQSKSMLSQAWKSIKAALNPPLMGGIAAVIVGVIPFTHKLVFPKHAPLAAITDSIERIGKLYTALQTFVVGGQLYSKR